MADIEIRAFGWRFLAILERPKPAPDLPTTAAPSHVHGSFDEAGYTSGRGSFGFRQETVQ